VNLFTANDTNIKLAAETLLNGGIVAFPTETVYGLGADATQEESVKKIYEIKNRPFYNPLIIHIEKQEWLAGIAYPDGRLDALIKAFWPGPITFILKKRLDNSISQIACSGLTTVAVRQPENEIARKLLYYTKRPIAAPSANLSGRTSPTHAKHVLEDFGNKIEIILDSDLGSCKTGIESTVLDLSSDPACILRPGFISKNSISSIIGPVKILSNKNKKIISPGQMIKHYAPKLPLRINAEKVKKDEALIGFGNTPNATRNLSKTENLEEAAKNLYGTLRELDDPAKYSGIAIKKIPNKGLGIAINDRINRASWKA